MGFLGNDIYFNAQLHFITINFLFYDEKSLSHDVKQEYMFFAYQFSTHIKHLFVKVIVYYFIIKIIESKGIQ